MTVMWGIHMAEIDYQEPLSDGYISIGWPAMGDMSTLAKNRDAFKARLHETHPDEKPGAIPVKAGVLFRFCNEMQEGDLVVFPSKPNRMVNIGEIVGSYTYVPDAKSGYVHRRKVIWRKQLSRTTFSQGALYEIGSAITLFQVTSNFEEFEAALHDGDTSAVELDESTQSNVAESVEETTDDYILKRLKRSLNPYEFEEFVAHLLQCMGYFSRVTSRSGDSGIDVIAHRDELGFEPPIIKVQCKQIESSIGSPDIQKLSGAIQAGEFGLFITLGSYTTGAFAEERARPNIRLIGGNELADLILRHYPKFSQKWKDIIQLKQVYVPGS